MAQWRLLPWPRISALEVRCDELEPTLRPVARHVDPHPFRHPKSMLVKIEQPRLRRDIGHVHEPDDVLADAQRVLSERAITAAAKSGGVITTSRSGAFV